MILVRFLNLKFLKRICGELIGTSNLPHQAVVADRSIAGLAGRRLDVAGHSPYPAAMIMGLSGAWQTASMR
jgi:hypothetical protein